MKANKFQSYLIIVLSLLATLKTSLIALWMAYSKKHTRQDIDRLARAWAMRLLRIVKLNYKVSDPCQLHLDPNRNYVIVSNHVGNYDIPLILVALPGSIRMMAKKVLFKVPIWGKAMRTSEFIPIDRENSKQAIQDLKYAKEKIKSGIILWIAPEGTRSTNNELRPFKKGAFVLARQTNAIIIPVGIQDSAKALPAKTLNFSVGETATIHIGKPIDSAQYKAADKDQLVKDVEESVRKVLSAE